MATLWKAKVLALEENQVRLQIRQVHPDAGPFASTRQFALRLLHEQALGFNEDFQNVALGPLGDAISEDQVYDEDWMGGEAKNYVPEVSLIESSGPALSEPEVMNMLLKKIFPHQDPKFLSPADLQKVEKAYSEFWSQEDQLPWATYLIRVSDPRWIAHLKKGQSWNSAAY